MGYIRKVVIPGCYDINIANNTHQLLSFKYALDFVVIPAGLHSEFCGFVFETMAWQSDTRSTAKNANQLTIGYQRIILDYTQGVPLLETRNKPAK